MGKALLKFFAAVLNDAFADALVKLLSDLIQELVKLIPSDLLHSLPVLIQLLSI